MNKLVVNKYGYLDWPDYSKKFGYCSFSNVYNNKGISLYITKYIKKNINDMSLLVGKHLYYCSKGLKRAKKIFEGNVISEETLNFDFENDFCKIKTFETEEELRKYFKDSIFIEKI